jgi:hypothetical protein
MSKDHQHVVVKLSSNDAFASVAFWQLMSFILLLCFIWVSELIDLPKLIFDCEDTPFNLYRVCVLSASVIAAAVISVGHTYERQKAVIGRMLMTCVYCHRVMHEDGSWEHVEEYFMRNYPMEVGHGACPACESMLQSVQEKNKT